MSSFADYIRAHVQTPNHRIEALLKALIDSDQYLATNKVVTFELYRDTFQGFDEVDVQTWCEENDATFRQEKEYVTIEVSLEQ